jgi:superfamily II DNA/RNA helicase
MSLANFCGNILTILCSSLARHTERHVTETKFKALQNVLSQHISGRRERLLIFTEDKDTLDFLLEKLTNLGFRCCTIHCGMPLQKRIDAEREFFEQAPSAIVTTEAAGEGINLQF